MVKKCGSIDEVRTQIDALDEQIVSLLAERSFYVQQAAGFKPTRADVVVPDRIEAIVTRVRALAAKDGMDQDTIEAIYRAMIQAFIAHEGQVWDKLPANS